MPVLGELLFYRRDGVALEDALRHRNEQVAREAVDGLSDKDFVTKTDDALAQSVANNLKIEPLNVAFDQGHAEVKEISLDVRDVFGDRARVKGLRATKTFQFTGDRYLWELRPNPYDMNPLHGDVSGQKLVLGMDVREHDADQAVTYIKDVVSRIQKYLQTQETQITAFNSGLLARVLPLIQARRARLGKAVDLLKNLQN